MASIGNFIGDADEDTYVGHVIILTMARCDVRLRPADKSGNSGPDYRLIADTPLGHVELGAAWKRTSENGRDDLSVEIEDPALPARSYARLFTDESGGNATRCLEPSEGQGGG
jgi:uncharacterized protein (DUF736 family)